MKIVRSAEALREKLREEAGKVVGLVPTMGYLHEGHLSLVAECRRRTEVVVVSIFVNPTQFGPNEDFSTYPRDERRDLGLLETAGADIVFIPTVEEMYPSGNVTDITVKSRLTKILCAKSRPTHFDGVTNVVSRLFCLVKPDYAFFGRKDAQQLAVITRMAEDMRIGTKIVGCPIVREEDGLALSSRNTYLSADERNAALSLSKSLFQAEKDIDSGMSSDKVKETVRRTIEAAGGKVDYVEMLDPMTLEDLEFGSDGSGDLFQGDYLLALAAYFGKTRLIDNRARIDGKCI